MSTRRKFLAGSAVAVAGVFATPTSAAAETPVLPRDTETVSLCGEWLFRSDADNVGTERNWHHAGASAEGWRKVVVPHTWQVEAALSAYRGVCWYRRVLDV